MTIGQRALWLAWKFKGMFPLPGPLLPWGKSWPTWKSESPSDVELLMATLRTEDPLMSTTNEADLETYLSTNDLWITLVNIAFEDSGELPPPGG